ncbi:MAG: D-ribose pyranase [Fervidobacterium sp.]|uniref:D-ribose pyranase n=1 Tax=Fervidobacterium gondwanense DSM 13020 TaxID=1121883 RepID=A0A1M7RT34_FERGO|nr:D-ribose pyranase [Fervidobacterium gondwanense]UXF00273.1 ribose pyranase [Fervidobacterium riparium]SHN49497.1 D-ribose pyranase [Fervidobacterium gondwanense DSM 13020]
MKKSGIFNSQIAKVVASMGHKDTIAIVDMGFPVPDSTERIDLVLDYGKPTFFEVLEQILKELEVEEVIIANESKDEFVQEIQKRLPNAKIKRTSHEELKELSKKCKAVIRTGDVKPYNNAIFVSGVIF